MESLFKFLREIKKSVCPSEITFLNRQLEKALENKPYLGLTIIHNIPFTPQTLIKLEVLYHGGANLIVTSPSFMDIDTVLLSEFKRVGGIYTEIIDANMDVDICLDCAGELINKVKPKIGTVEITGTGTNKYKALNLNYPVISVDMCEIKELEAILGTGEAFVRAFMEITGENITNKNFMIVGFGKVGKGIAQNLKRHTKYIWVVDQQQENLNIASQQGFIPIDAKDCSCVNKIAKDMFCIVSATGIKNVISDHYNPEHFKGKYHANMGGEDEFGDKFDKSKILCKGKPINFFVKNPTLMRYLDPVFYAHNMGVELLINHNLKNELHPFPANIASQVVYEWQDIHKEDILI